MKYQIAFFAALFHEGMQIPAQNMFLAKLLPSAVGQPFLPSIISSMHFASCISILICLFHAVSHVCCLCSKCTEITQDLFPYICCRGLFPLIRPEIFFYITELVQHIFPEKTTSIFCMGFSSTSIARSTSKRPFPAVIQGIPIATVWAMAPPLKNAVASMWQGLCQ